MIRGSASWVAVFSILAPATAWSQEKATSADVQVTVNSYDTYRFDNDLETAGSVALATAKASVDVRITLDPRDFLLVNGGVEYDRYDFSSGAEILPGVTTGLFEDMFVVRGEATYIRVFDESWSGLLYGSAMTQFESGAPVEKGLSYALGVGASYRVDADLTIGMMLRAQTRIQDAPWVYPLFFIDWKITPELYLTNETKAGYGFILGYGLSEKNRLAVETRAYYLSHRFRLDNGSIPSKGIADDMRFSWDLGVRYRGEKGPSLGFYVGADVWQHLGLEDRTGSDLEEIHNSPQPYIAVFLSWAF